MLLYKFDADLIQKALILMGYGLAGVFTVLALYFLLIKLLRLLFKN